MDNILIVIYNSEYDLGIKILDYSDLENELYEMYQNSRNARSLEELREFSFFWMDVIDYLRQYSKTGWEQYQNVLNEGAVRLEQNILKYVTNNNEKKYHNSLHEYIIERAKEIGILKMPWEISCEAIVRKVCDNPKINKKTQEKIQKKIKK